MNLSELSFDKLLQLKQDVEKEIRARKNQEASALANMVQERAAQLGVSVDEILGMLGKKASGRKTVLAPKYANPKNPSETWTGKGRKPGWYVAALASGHTEEALRIK